MYRLLVRSTHLQRTIQKLLRVWMTLLFGELTQNHWTCAAYGVRCSAEWQNVGACLYHLPSDPSTLVPRWIFNDWNYWVKISLSDPLLPWRGWTKSTFILLPWRGWTKSTFILLRYKFLIPLLEHAWVHERAVSQRIAAIFLDISWNGTQETYPLLAV